MSAPCVLCGARRRPAARRGPIPGQIELDWTARYWPEASKGVERPFAWAPVEPFLPEGLEIAAQLLKASWKTLHTYRTEGLTVWQADRVAGRLGLTPYEIWPDFDRLAQLDDDLDDDE